MADQKQKQISKGLKSLITGLVLVVGLIWGVVWQLPDEKLHLVFCEVGQGDATLVIQGSNQVLVDGGPGSGVLECLANHLPFWDRTIEMVILTHPEADHFTGLIDVVERYDVEQFVVNSVVNDSTAFWEFRDRVLAEGGLIHSPVKGEKLKLGLIEFLVLWPGKQAGDKLVWQKNGFSDREKNKEAILGVASPANGGGDLNETSIVLQLVYGDFDALLTGDIPTKIEDQLDWDETDPIEVLKVAHHGSKYSTGEGFLGRLKPELGVIMVGKNSFGHPTQEVLDRLTAGGVDYLRTDQQGEVEIVSDGKSLEIEP